MTTFGDAIRQIETVLNDTEYPPTYQELLVLKRTLKMMCTNQGIRPMLYNKSMLAGSPVMEVIPTTVSQYMRQIERRREMSGTAIA